jgi:hypothetical protein
MIGELISYYYSTAERPCTSTIRCLLSLKPQSQITSDLLMPSCSSDLPPIFNPFDETTRTYYT